MNIRTERVDVSDVITKVSDGKLEIFVDEEDLSFWFFQRWSGDIEIDLTYTENLEHISVSGSASLESKSLIDSEEVELYVSNSGYADIDIRSNDLEVEVSNSGKADVRAESRNVRANATNSARLNLSGKSDSQEYWISNSSKILASEMESQKTQIDATNSAYSEIYVVEELIATANNSATIRYKGNPEKIQSNAGQSGSIRKD